jgi:mannose-6-phosphate isomerase-like protein (cupin superfamily)
MDSTHAFSTIDELGDGYGFRKVRGALDVTAFGVNAMVMPPGFEAFWHFHDVQDELYFVHTGTLRMEVGDPAAPDVRELGPGGLAHVRSTTPRRMSNASEVDDLVVLVVGAADGYVGRDGQLVDMADLERRAAFGQGEVAPAGSSPEA